MTETVTTAISGSPTIWRPMPPDAPAEALAALDRLAGEIADSRAFGFLEPAAVRGVMRQETLSVCLSMRGASTLHDYMVSEWRWGLLWACSDWYEEGWHPIGPGYLALAGAWQRRLWDTLNPGKRHGLKLRRVSK